MAKNQGTSEVPTLLLDLKQAGAVAGLTYWQIYGLITRGQLKSVWVGDQRYVRRATLMRWMEQAEEVA